MKGYPVVLAEAAPTRAPINTRSWRSGGAAGDGYYHLMDVIIDGKPTLVGGHRGDWRLFNLVTGEVLFDWVAVGTVGGTPVTFYQPPAAVIGAQTPAGVTADAAYVFVDPISTPQLGLGSYAAQEQWYDPVDKVMKYYYGGYIKVYPTTVTMPTASNDQTFKHSFVLETTDHKTFRPIFLTRNDYAYVGAGDNTTVKWVSEVSGLLGTPYGLLVSMGDGHKNLGLYRYQGGGTAICSGGTNQVTELAAALCAGFGGDLPLNGILFDGSAYFKNFASSSTLLSISLTTGTRGTASVGTVPLRGTATTYSPSGGTNYGNIGSLGRQCVIGYDGVLVIGDPAALSGAGLAIPFLPNPSPGVANAIRAAGWRTPMVNVAGGLVFAVNCYLPGNNGDAAQSYLCYLQPGGAIRIIDVAGQFHGMCQFNNRLYYSSSPLYAGDTFQSSRILDSALKSVAIEDIGRAVPPPFAENFNFASYNATTSGVAGFFASIPTSGYSRGELIIYSDTSGNLVPVRIGAQKSSGTGTNGNNSASVTYAGVAVTLNTQLVVDLAPYLKNGDILALKFSANAAVSGRITLQA